LAFFGLLEDEEVVGGEGKDAALRYVVGRGEFVGGHPTF
jgi:hypothetical protein